MSKKKGGKSVCGVFVPSASPEHRKIHVNILDYVLRSAQAMCIKKCETHK